MRLAPAALIPVALVFIAGQAVQAEDDFPIVGTYLRDAACKGNGSDRPDIMVKITREGIESTMGACRFVSRKRSGQTIAAQVQCKLPGDQTILGDITFTLRDDGNVEFQDSDHTSDGTLHRCSE